jgi:hypothetical protein
MDVVNVLASIAFVTEDGNVIALPEYRLHLSN